MGEGIGMRSCKHDESGDVSSENVEECPGITLSVCHDQSAEGHDCSTRISRRLLRLWLWGKMQDTAWAAVVMLPSGSSSVLWHTSRFFHCSKPSKIKTHSNDWYFTVGHIEIYCTTSGTLPQGNKVMSVSLWNWGKCRLSYYMYLFLQGSTYTEERWFRSTNKTACQFLAFHLSFYCTQCLLVCVLILEATAFTYSLYLDSK